MRVLSIFYIDPSKVTPPTQEDMERMDKLIDEMRGKGVLIDTGGKLDGQFEAIVSRKNGKTSVTDGPFTESKEVIGGYGLIEVNDSEEAIAWTNRFLDLVPDATCHLHEVSVG